MRPVGQHRPPCFATKRSMQDSESASNESVEQPTNHQPELETCPICGVEGLPERIAAHDCQTPTVAHPHLHVVVSRVASTNPATQDDTQQTPNTPSLDHLTIEWTPTEGSTQTLTFESTATGVECIESTTTATTCHTGGTDSVSPLTLLLTTRPQSTTQEAHHE